MTKIILPQELLEEGFKHIPANLDEKTSEHYKKGFEAYFYCNCDLLTRCNLKTAKNGVINVTCDKNEHCGKVGRRIK